MGNSTIERQDRLTCLDAAIRVFSMAGTQQRPETEAVIKMADKFYRYVTNEL